MSSDIANQMVLVSLAQDLSPPVTWLGEIVIGVSNSVSLDKTGNLEGLLTELLFFSVGSEGVRFVVSSASLVSVDDHITISLSIDDSSSVWAVDRDLLVVDSQSVSVGISI